MTRSSIPQKRRIFIACEGESEGGYGALLQRLCLAQGLPVHLVMAIQKGGSPLDIAQRAAKAAEAAEAALARKRKRRDVAPRFILLDRDKLEEVAGMEAEVLRILTQARITPVWQTPDHEGFLLRHFSGHERDDPPRRQALAALQKIWPDYRKHMAARDLERILTLDHVRRAAPVTPGLSALLTILGLTS